MTTLTHAEFDALHVKLDYAIGDAVRAFANENGHVYSSSSFFAQSSWKEGGVRELLNFGMDVWSEGNEDPDDGEILPIEPVIQRRAAPSRLGMAFALAACLLLLILPGIDLTLSADAAGASAHPTYEHDATLPVTSQSVLLTDAIG